ncbi:MAG: TIR domain-containing protein [Dehalococcoidia bacterium]|nr:TIR domain-containing protein [Dehalococcoidia bacterium]
MPDQIKNAFISHVFEDDDALGKLKALVAGKGLTVRDSSIDSSKRNKATDENYIKSEILAPRIKWAGVLVVLVSPQTRHSSFVNWEIEYAAKLGKRIVGVWAHGAANTDLPEALQKYADTVVGWNSDRIADAICGEDLPWTDPGGAPREPVAIPRYRC